MFKLMKYEFKKQMFSKYIILALLAIFEIMFLVGLLFSKEDFLGISTFLLTLLTIGSLFFFAFECIDTFSKDLKQTSSYMLFLTPKTSYSIVAAKIFSAAIQIIIAAIIFFTVFLLDSTLIFAKFDQLNELKNMILKMIQQFFKLDINIPLIISGIVFIISNWILTITTAFLSITLSTTVLANKKYKGILSFGLFLLLNTLFSYIIKEIISLESNFQITVQFNLLADAAIIIFIIITYLCTSWLLDKKVSV